MVPTWAVTPQRCVASPGKDAGLGAATAAWPIETRHEATLPPEVSKPVKFPAPNQLELNGDRIDASKPCASCSPSADLSVLPGAMFSTHPSVGSTTPPAGALPVPGSSRATRPDAACHRPPCRCTESPSYDRWPSPGSSPDSGRG